MDRPGDELDAATREAAAFDFVADYMDDEADGAVRSLAEYLARYPGAEAEVAAEYLRLTGAVAPAASDEAPAAPDDGRERIGHYVLDRELGRGGQGAVWLATDEHLGRRVALKLLSTPFVTEERRARFRREAESIARLDHPGLAGVHDADLDAALPWIAMRHVEGVDLRGALDSALESKEAAGPRVAPLVPWIPTRRADVARVLLFFERAARALHAAHEEGVVHRDIKPGNLMVTPEGEPVVLDFGLARDLAPRDEATPSSDLTREGEIFGTPAYMAPEQLSGRPDDVDRRADVWSLGVTLYEALTGQRPFTGDAPHALATAILTRPVPDPRAANDALSADVRIVLETALERDVARRYPKALEFAEDLRRIREFEPIRARPAGPMLRLGRWCRREPAWAAAIGVTLVALVAGLFIQTHFLGIARSALAQANARLFVSKVDELLEASPAAALALGLEAVDEADEWWTRSKLYGPLEALTLERVFDLQAARVWDAELFDNGRALVACGNGGHVATFDLASGRRLGSFELSGAIEGAARGLRDLVVHGDAVLVAGGDGAVRRLSLPELDLVWERDLGAGAVVSVSLGSVDVACLGRGGALVVLNAGSGDEVRRIALSEREAAEVVCIRPSAGGDDVLLTAPRPGIGLQTADPHLVRLWSAATGEELLAQRFERPVTRVVGRGTGPALEAAFTVVTEGGDFHTLRRTAGGWRAQPGRAPTSTIGIPFALPELLEGSASDSPFPYRLDDGGPPGRPILVALQFARGAALLRRGGPIVSATCGEGPRFVPLSDGALRHRSLIPQDRLLATDDGRLVSFGITERVHLWRTRRTPECWLVRPESGAPVTALASAGGHSYVAHERAGPGGDGQALRRFDLPLDLLANAGGVAASDAAHVAVDSARRNVAIATDSTFELLSLEGQRAVAALPAPAIAVAIDAGGSTAVAVARTGHVVVLREDGSLFDVQVDDATVAAVGVGGAQLAVGDAGGAVHVFDVEGSGRGARHVLVPDAGERSTRGGDAVTGLDFSPDGERLAVVSRGTWLDEWFVATGERTAPPDSRRVLLHHCRYLPDSERLVVVGRGNYNVEVRPAPYLRTPTVEPVRPAERHEGALLDHAQSPDGKLIATASADGTVMVWSSSSGAVIARFDLHGAPVTAVEFVGDGTVLSGDAEGGVARWPIDPVPLARSLAPRGLDPHERALLDRR